jgi:hypothetical protein
MQGSAKEFGVLEPRQTRIGQVCGGIGHSFLHGRTQGLVNGLAMRAALSLRETQERVSIMNAPATPGNVVLLQRLEGLAAFGLGIAAYIWLGQSWLLFALLVLAPDLSMLGYLKSPRTGAWAYNLAHTYLTPALLALLGLAVGPVAYGLAAIWLVHIGFDRAMGYGLKLETGFKHTHLGTLGRAG